MFGVTEEFYDIYRAVTDDGTQKVLMSLLTNESKEKILMELLPYAGEEILKNGLTEESKQKIYWEMQRNYWKEDILNWAEDNGIAITTDEKEMECALDNLEDNWDSNVSHWDNIARETDLWLRVEEQEEEEKEEEDE